MSRRSSRFAPAWVVLLLAARAPAAPPLDSVRTPQQEQLQRSIDKHLGRPYSWGATGLKSYDCSGFVWRVMQDNGILIKRTTARKYYYCLPKVRDSERWEFGNVVFLSNLKHCGIVDTRDRFYHAQTHRGTNLSKFDPLWRSKVCGVRAMPSAAAPPDTTR